MSCTPKMSPKVSIRVFVVTQPHMRPFASHFTTVIEANFRVSSLFSPSANFCQNLREHWAWLWLDPVKISETCSFPNLSWMR